MQLSANLISLDFDGNVTKFFFYFLEFFRFFVLTLTSLLSFGANYCYDMPAVLQYTLQENWVPELFFQILHQIFKDCFLFSQSLFLKLELLFKSSIVTERLI